MYEPQRLARYADGREQAHGAPLEPTGPEQELYDEEAPLDEVEADPYAEAEAHKREQQEFEARCEKLNAMGQALQSKRKSAVDGRYASGIELDWVEDEDQYQGIDDANRAYAHAAGRHRIRKPKENGTPEGLPPNSGSHVYLPITRPYTDAAAARMADMLLPADEFPFELTPTPVPELVAAAAAPKETLGPPGPDGKPVPLADHAKAKMAEAKKIAERAQTRIEDWLTETGWHGETRKVLDDAARMGTGVLKGPIPMRRKQAVWDAAAGQIKLNEEIKPGSKCVSVWNCYPDPLCGEDIHRGEYFWERDDVTSKAVRALKGTPGILDWQIDQVLLEGAQKSDIDPNNRPEQLTSEVPFEIWYYHGSLTREDLEAAGCNCDDYAPPGTDIALPAVVTMINDRVIRATINPLDNGSFPYDFLVWQPRKGLPYGAGVPRQLRDPQRMIVAATRALMDNAGLSAGPQIVIMKDVVDPANGDWTIRPRKIWYAKAGKDVREVQHAFHVFEIASRQAELMEVIQFALKMAEDVTGLPMLLQGQQGNAPDTVGGMTMLNNNASSVLRRIARLVDFHIIEPHVQRYYQWLLENGQDQTEKGLFIVKARGSSVLVERDLQNKAILGFVQLSVQPAYGADPRKAYAEGLKAHRIDPERLQYTDDEWKTIQENMAKKTPDPRIEVEKMRIESTQAKLGQEQAFDAKQADADRNNALLIESIRAELKEGDQGVNRENTVANIKAMLAGKVMDNAAHSQEMALKRDVGSGV